MSYQRVMGLDVGDMTIGVSISDPFLLMAQGLKTIRRTTLEEDIKEINNIIQDRNIFKIVVGLPLNMNNSIGPQAEKVLNFVDFLKQKFNIPIILEDERLSTVSAEKMLIENNIRRNKRKKIIDTVASTYILQVYLDRNKM